MKIIKYRTMTEAQCGFGKNSGVVQSFSERIDDWSEEAEEWVKSIAYNGEYIIEDDGRPEPPPTTEEVLLELAADHEARLCEIELGV